MGEVEFTQDDLDIFQVALIWRFTKGRHLILCRCLHHILDWPFTTPNCTTRSRRMSRSTRWCRRWSTTRVQHPSTKYKRWNHPRDFENKIGWNLKCIAIAQIMDEGMVKPEDHQDVATQMWANFNWISIHCHCSYTFYATGMDDMTKVRKAIFMFSDLFGMDRFSYQTVVTFFVGKYKSQGRFQAMQLYEFCQFSTPLDCLTFQAGQGPLIIISNKITRCVAAVKQSYRNVVYHNFTHGFHVANSIYSILKVLQLPNQTPNHLCSGVAGDLQSSGKSRDVYWSHLPRLGPQAGSYSRE